MAEMNGENGHACNMLDWKVGLCNAVTKKFLTAETFGSFNVSGTTLKKKQIWTLEQDRNEDNVVNIKSCMNKKIATEPKHGEIDTEVEGHDEKFIVEYGTGKHSGQWRFKHKQCCTYLGTNPDHPDNVLCKSTKVEDDNVYWNVQLCIHPQINLRNVKRTRYAHLENDQLRCSEVVPWGTDALITLEYIDGKYAFKTSDSRYLQNDGALVPECNDNCLFFLEVKSGIKESGLAFKDVNQCYLTAVGPGTLKTNKKSVTKDELFTIEDSHPQVFFVSNKGKKASIKQGIDVSANQDTNEDTETFQLEHQKDDIWAVLTSNGKYWTVASTGSGIQAGSSSVKNECLFHLEWQGDGTVGIKANINSKYISHKDTGALVAVADTLTEKEKFQVQIMNRPLLVLKCKHGFVSAKPKSQEYACNRADYDIYELEGDGNGKYTLKEPSTGKYWRVNEEQVVVSDDSPSHFVIEFRKKTYISIKSGEYFLQGKQNGRIMAKATELESDETGNDITLWEF